MNLLLLACVAAPPRLEVQSVEGGLQVEASAPVEEVRILGTDQQARFRQQLAAPASSLRLTVELPPGNWILEAGGTQQPFEVPPRPPVRLQFQVRPGGEWVDAADHLDVPVMEGQSKEVLVGIQGGPERPATVKLEPGGIFPVTEERQILRLTLGMEPIRLSLGSETGEPTPWSTTVELRPRPETLAELRERIQVQEHIFPADAEGQRELARPSFQIQLPSAAWAPVQNWLRSGRRQDEEAPWGYYSLSLKNSGTVEEDVVVRLRNPHPAFRPRLRGALSGTGEVSVLMRVPAQGSAVASLPVYVNPALLEPERYPMTVAVLPLGGDEPILEENLELSVQAADPLAGMGVLATGVLALAADLWVLRRLRGWLQGNATSELMAIAMVGSALFVVGGASDLLTVSLAALLGPFAPLLTGLVGDVGRIVLLGTLLGLQPRPGTLSLAVLSGWLLRGLTMGSFSATDVIYVGSSVAFGEGFAWMAGPSRLRHWGEESEGRRWIRLSLAFGGASLFSTVTGFWIQMVFYRLYYAPWYLLMQAVLIGGLYPLMASRIAARLVGQLQRVAP